MSNCLNCGAELRPGAKFCTKCGSPVQQQPQETAVPAKTGSGREVQRLLGFDWSPKRMGMAKATGTLVICDDRVELIKIKGAMAKKMFVGGIIGNVASQYGKEVGVDISVPYSDLASVECAGSMMTNNYIVVTRKNGDKVFFRATFATHKSCTEAADLIRSLAGL